MLLFVMSHLKSFERLEKLHKVDLGFYVLGLHSFIESYIRNVTDRRTEYFSESLHNYDKYLSRKKGSGLNHNFIRILRDDHINTNKVRHDFSQLMSGEVESSTHHFIKFLKKTEIDPSDYSILKGILKNWKSRVNSGEEEAKKLQAELLKAKDKVAVLEGKACDNRNINNQLKLLEKEKAVLDHKLEYNKESLDTLKNDKKILEEKIVILTEEASESRALQDYIHYLSRFSLYTRTRAEYEKSVLRLSIKQKEAIDLKYR